MKSNGSKTREARIYIKERGGLSIFLAIVLFAVTVLAGLLVDIARVSAAKNQTARALDIAAISTLANYETDIKNEYGLFAIHMPVPDDSLFAGYIKLNLGIDTDSGFFADGLFESGRNRTARLYNYRIERLSMNTVSPLAEIDVVERQILEYMKYRAPAALATGVADYIKQAATAAKMADAAQIKVEIDRKLARIGKEQENLRDYLYGDLKTTRVGDKYALNFNKNANRSQLADKIAESYDMYAAYTKNHYEESLRRSKSNAPDAEADKAERDMIKEARNELQSAFDELSENETGVYLAANRGAINSVEKIAEVSDELRLLYDSLDESIAKFDAEDLKTPFSVPLLDDAERGKESLIDAKSAREKEEALSENIETLTLAVNGMNELRRELFGYTPPDEPMSASAITQRLASDLSSYNYDITYSYQRATPLTGYADPREYVDDRVAELLGDKEKDADKKLSDIGINVSGLPSRNLDPWWSRYFTKSEPSGFVEYRTNDSQYEVMPSSNNLGYDQPTSMYNGVTEGGGIGYQPFNADSDYPLTALGEVSGVGNVLSEGDENLRDTYYVGEYVLSMFNNSVKDKYRWGGSSPPVKTAFFGAEVEYILHGNDKQSGNLFWTKVQLLTTRFAMNFIHVHSDTRKLEFARNIAVTFTSWWSSGMLVPVATDLVLAAWSIKEAIADVDDLLEGKRTPFIKLAGDWKTNIGVSAEGQPKTKESMQWSYLDYLRIFLLTTPRQTKLARICDLIEINTKYAGRELKVKDLYCTIDGELTASVNYLFLTSAFMPRFLTTRDNRHLIEAKTARDLF